jgi:hyaluronan synthase
MSGLWKKCFFWCTLIFSIILLSFMYIYHFSIVEWSWVFSVPLLYGVLITPFLVFSLIGAYRYKPLPDVNFRPKVSVVVPCYNEELEIAKTIDSILGSDYPTDLLELVVVDDKSVDNSLDVIKNHSCASSFRVVVLPHNMGKRHAFAEGLKYCSGEIVVCVDSDAVLASDALKNLVQPFSDERVFCVCGNAVVSNEKQPKMNNWLAHFQKVWYVDGFHIRKGTESLFGIVLCCSGVLSGFRRDKVELVVDEWLNESFLGRKCVSGDDSQLTNHMLALGGKSVFQSNAVTYTVAPHRLKQFVKQQIRWGRGALFSLFSACKIFARRRLVEQLQFYSTVIITFLSPVALLASVTSLVIVRGWFAVGLFLGGHLLVCSVVALTNRVVAKDFKSRDVLFRMGFFALMFFVTFVYAYAWLTPWRDNSWGTR